jgi:hypothetical protein
MCAISPGSIFLCSFTRTVVAVAELGNPFKNAAGE